MPPVAVHNQQTVSGKFDSLFAGGSQEAQNGGESFGLSIAALAIQPLKF